jgi:hypothetical protein
MKFTVCLSPRHLIRALRLGLVATALIAVIPQISLASDPTYTTVKTARFTLHIDRSAPLERQAYTAEEISTEALEVLNRTHGELSGIFNFVPQQQVVLRFLSPKEFQRQTGAPSWTSAMYYKNEITIPLNASGVDPVELERALRHEYVHAVVAEISEFRSPAWLDEGVAQIIEGEINPLLGPALRKWLIHNDPIPLDWLHGGFTTLDADIVPAAYAQSLFASRILIREFGYEKVVTYLKLLSKQVPEHKAFEQAFSLNKRIFEARLKRQLLAWVHSDQKHP